MAKPHQSPSAAALHNGAPEPERPLNGTRGGGVWLQTSAAGDDNG